jgi:hypothetical protein
MPDREMGRMRTGRVSEVDSGHGLLKWAGSTYCLVPFASVPSSTVKGTCEPSDMVFRVDDDPLPRRGYVQQSRDAKRRG